MRKVIEMAGTGMLALAGAMLVSMMLFGAANIVFRLGGAPIKGVYEIMGFFGALVIGLGLTNTQLRKGHIALTILSGKFPAWVERTIDGVSSLVCAAFFGMIAWKSMEWAFKLRETGELSETLRIIYYPFPLVMALGIGCMALAIACDLWDVISGGPGKAEKAKDGEDAS